MADKILSIVDGLHDELPSTKTAKAGRILITTDRGEMYYEPEDEKRVQINPQPDWTQNDETANDYIKNRPGGYEGLVEILPETTLNFDSISLRLTNCPLIEVGVTYTVTFDSTEYELVGRNDSEGMGLICIGNESHAWGGTDTGEPFIIFNNKLEDNVVVPTIYISSSTTLPCTYNIKIKAVAPVKINEKYLDIKNTNIINGSAVGSLRTMASTKEDSSYSMGDFAFAEGLSTIASGDYSHAEGISAKALGQGSHAEGHDTTASGDYSHTEGEYTIASGYASHAEGSSTTASGNGSHTEGNGTTASGDHQHVQGKYNIEDTSNTYADIIGNGSFNTRSNAATVDWQGNAWYAGDVYVGSTSGTNRDEGSKKLATEEHSNNTFANALKASKTDTAMLIDDISPVTHEMGVKVRGKNLIPYPYRETTKTENGITFTDNGDGTITVSGTATSQAYFYLFKNKTIKAGTYTLSGCPSGGGSSIYKILGIITASDGTKSYLSDYGNSATKTFTEDVTIDLRIQIENEQIVENLIFKPQLEYGTTATPYTPYVPDLTAVKVSRYGKNLFDKNNANIIVGYPDVENVINPASTTKSVYIPCAPNTTYTVSKVVTARFVVAFTDVLPASNVAVTGRVQNNTATSITSASSANSRYIVVWIYHSNYDTSITVDEVLATLQIEQGSTATEYEPYKTPTECTPTTDGTVEGVTSLYPNTTLMTDTDGVIIDCEYNRDINKFSGMYVKYTDINQSYDPISANAQSGIAVAEAVTEAKDYTDTKIGDIDTALDSIIALQNSYIGGNA